jgi:hypothetical protein
MKQLTKNELLIIEGGQQGNYWIDESYINGNGLNIELPWLPGPSNPNPWKPIWVRPTPVW